MKETIFVAKSKTPEIAEHDGTVFIDFASMEKGNKEDWLVEDWPPKPYECTLFPVEENILFNKRLNITEHDVEECTDQNTLLGWHSEVNKDIAEMQAQINTAKAERYTTGKYAESKWFNNINKAKALQGILVQKIQQRLSKLNQEKKEKYAEDFRERFIHKARELGLYDTIAKEL